MVRFRLSEELSRSTAMTQKALSECNASFLWSGLNAVPSDSYFQKSSFLFDAAVVKRRFALTGPAPARVAQAGDPSRDWIDKDTDHHVFRLTEEPGSTGLSFNEDAFTADGREMIYTAQDSVYLLDMTPPYATRRLLSGPVKKIVMGKNGPIAYFMLAKDPNLYAINVYTMQTLKIVALPQSATISTVNADDTLVAGTLTETQPGIAPQQAHSSAGRRGVLPRDIEPAVPATHALFTLDLRTAAIATVLRSSLQFAYVLFSPKDPNLLMYGFGGESKVDDEIWTVRTDGTMNRPIHQRTMDDEAATNAFWDSDGKTVWYDLQAPRGQAFYLASYNLDTGLRRWYPIERARWRVHYNAAVDDSVFCGDGSDASQAAKASDGRWIEIFFPRKPKPTDGPIQAGQAASADQDGLIQSGSFISHHLVNLSKNDYTTPPNARFSPTTAS